jgi:hypothetical protein
MERARLYFPKDGHFNPLGHRKTAEVLFTYLGEHDEDSR